MKISIQFILLFIMAACASAPEVRYSKDWKKDSRKLVKGYGDSLGTLYPEYVASSGFPKFEPKTTSYSKDLDNQTYAHAYRWKNRLQKFLEVEKHPEMVTDVNILIDFQNREMEKIDLDRSLGVIPFLPISDHVYENLRGLINPASTQLQLNNGMARFRAYVRGEDNKLPLVDGFTSYMLARMKHLADNRKRGLWPPRLEIENYLKGSDETLKEVEKLLSRWPGDEWKRDFEEFKLQEANYRAFLKRKVIPYARKTAATHPRYYAFNLKESGIFKTPAELIEMGEADYKSNYKLFKELAKKVAQKHKLPDDSPLEVIKYLKSKKFVTDKDILDSYNNEIAKLQRIVTEEDLFTLKAKPDFEVRFASQSEMNAMASPHFLPAPLMQKTKAKAQFVIPRITGAKGTDDYTFREAIMVLSAHEAIPGHAVQFHVMKERGITLIRAWFASNSANIEGWAFYAENSIYPYVEDEIKFAVLQRRLWRIARTFLDPQLNLGKITQARVKEVFVNELGFAESFAQTEFDRYSYIMPGQAPSYYYGYKILLDTKVQVKEKLKDSFTEKCFNDALLDQGLLPLAEVSSRLMKDLSCGD